MLEELTAEFYEPAKFISPDTVFGQLGSKTTGAISSKSLV